MKINKALFSLALASVTLSQLPLAALAQDTDTRALNNVVIEEEGEMNFSDVSPNHWAYRAIRKLVEKYGVIGGFPDGTFRGNRTLSRYEAAAMVAKVMEKVEEMTTSSSHDSSMDNTSSVDEATISRLKREFMSELEDLEGQLRRVSKDQQDLQKDIDETRDMVEMVKDMLPEVHLHGAVSSRMEAVTGDWKAFSTLQPQAAVKLGVMGHMRDGMDWVHFGTSLMTGTSTNPYINVAGGNDLALNGIGLNKMYVSLGNIHKNWLQVTLGRHDNPYLSTTELLWDKDLTLTGGYLRLRLGPKDNHLGVVLGNTHLGSVNNVADLKAPNMMAGSLYYKVGNEGWKFKVGASAYSFRNASAPATANAAAAAPTVGHSDGTNTNIGTASLLLSVWNHNVSLFGDLATNMGGGFAPSFATDKMGMVAGLRLGKLAEPGILPMLSVAYKRVGKEAVYEAFNEDQFALNNSNTEAIEVKAGWMLDSSSKLMATYQMSGPTGKFSDSSVNNNVLRVYLAKWF